MSKSIAEFMERQVATVAPSDNLEMICPYLCDTQHSLVVVIEGAQAIGIITERDIVQQLREHGNPSKSRAMEIMSSPVISVDLDASLFDAYSIMTSRHIRHLIVTASDGNVVGTISLTEMLAGMGIEYFVDLKEIASIMTRKMIRVKPDDMMQLAVNLMYRHHISCIVVEQQWKPAGIITERDVVEFYRRGLDADATPVSEIMSSPVISMADSGFIPQANKLMRDNNLRHLVLVDSEQRLSGLISQSDLVSCMEAGYISHLKELIYEKEQQLDLMVREHGNLIRELPNPVVMLDGSGHIVDANSAALQLTERSRKSLTSISIGEIIDDNQEALLTRARQGEVVHTECKLNLDNKSKTLFISLLPASGNPQSPRIYAIIHDITERRLASNKLASNENKFLMLAQWARAVPWSMKVPGGEFVYIDNQVENLLGHSVESWRDKQSWLERIHPEDRENALKHLNEAATTGREQHFDCRMQSADGLNLPFKVYIGPACHNGYTFEFNGFMLAINE